MMLTPEGLLDAIVLLSNDNKEESKKIVGDLISIYEKELRASTVSPSDTGAALAFYYIKMLKGMISGSFDPNNKDESRRYLLKIKSSPALEKRDDLYKLLSDILLDSDPLSEDKVSEIRKSIFNQIALDTLGTTTKRLYARINAAKEISTPEEQSLVIQDLIGEAKTAIEGCASAAISSESATTNADVVNFADKTSMKAAATRHKERTVSGVLKTGLKGLNMMFGKAGGVAQGESVVFNALAHNFKSSMLQSIAMWAARYNVPVVPEGTKALILLISLENEAFQNFIWMARKVYREETDQSPDDLEQDDLIDWAYDRFQKSGYTLEILRYQPEDFGYYELVRLVAYYETLGYHISLMVIDYMNLMNKNLPNQRGFGSGDKNHTAVRDLYRYCCNFLKAKGITMITAHQINRKGQELANSGKRNVVKYFNAEHAAESVDVQREVDTSINLHIERNHQGIAFLTASRTKRRYDEETPLAHQYFAYPFLDGGVKDDAGKNYNGFTRDIYAWDVNDYRGNPDHLKLILQDKNSGEPKSAKAADIF